MTVTTMDSSLNQSGTAMPDGWVKAGFPSTVNDLKQSIKFVKRLVAIGFSQILYLRTEIPDDCFKPHQIGNLSLCMLKAKSSSNGANTLTMGLKNAMDALDHGYLRQLIILILDNKDKPEEPLETYTFNFNKPNIKENKSNSPGFTLTQSARKQNKLNKEKTNEILVNNKIVDSENLIRDGIDNQTSDENAEETVYRATKLLLKKLIATIQVLDELPVQTFMTVKIGFHDDITPPGYNPRGFRECIGGPGCTEKRPIKLGQVNSRFHDVDLVMSSNTEGMDVPQEMEEKELANPNTSFISLKPGLDVSVMDKTQPESGSIDLSHGSNVEICQAKATKRSCWKDIEPITGNNINWNETFINSKSNVKSKGKGKKSKGTF